MEAIPITLRQIDYVIAAAQAGGTAAAARMLNVSQPSVSLAIARVEAHFEQALFLRNSGQGIELSPFGTRKLAELRLLRAQAQSALGKCDSGLEPVNFGVFSTLGPRYAPALLRTFQEQGGAAQVRLFEGDLEQIKHWLATGRIDLALIYDFGLPSSFDIVPLSNVRPYALVSANHQHARRDSVTIGALLKDPLVLMNLPHSRAYFLALAQMNDVRPRIGHETGSVEMLRAMVANGLGVGMLATDIAQDTACDGQPVRRLELEGMLPPHRIALAQVAERKQSKAAAQFLDHVVGALRQDQGQDRPVPG